MNGLMKLQKYLKLTSLGDELAEYKLPSGMHNLQIRGSLLLGPISIEIL